MNKRSVQLRIIAVGLLLSFSSFAVPSDPGGSPYSVIVTRNPFELKPPPPPAPPPEPPKPPPSNLELTGISKIFGKLQAFFNVKEQNGKSSSKMLTLGEAPEDGIEVLSIDEKEGEVKVRNRGVESVLTFTKNAPKIASGPPPAGFVPPPAAAPQPAFAPPTSVFSEPNAPAPQPEAVRNIPSRSIRTPPLTPAQQQALQQQQQMLQQQHQQNKQSVEAQRILMEINSELNPGGPPLPPIQ